METIEQTRERFRKEFPALIAKLKFLEESAGCEGCPEQALEANLELTARVKELEARNECGICEQYKKENAALTKENAILVSRNKELIRSRRVRKGNHSGSVSRVIRERRKRLGG